MKKILYLFLVVSQFCVAQAPVYQWAKKAGNATGLNLGNGICTDKANNVYVTGFMDSTYQYCDSADATPIHYSYSFLSKYTSGGALEWTQKVNGVDNNNGLHVAVDSAANVYVAGIFTEYDTNLWTGCIHLKKPYDGMIFNTTVPFDTTIINITIFGNDTLRDTTRIDTVYYTGNDTIHGTDLEEVYIAKYDSSGHFIWVQKAFAVNSNLAVNGITTDNFGNLYITGSFSGTARFGKDTAYCLGNSNFYLAKYTTDSGNIKWLKHGANAGTGVGVGFSNVSNDIYVTGTYQDTANFTSTMLRSFGNFNVNDIFLAAIDTAGNWVWAEGAGGLAPTDVKGITIDESGNIIITGYLTPGSVDSFASHTIAGDTNQIFLAKYTSLSGNSWVVNAGGAKAINVNGITTDATGNIYLTGDFQDTAIFGNHSLYSVGGYDVFISKYSTAGAKLGSQSAGGSSNDLCNSIAVDGANGVYITGSFQDTCKFGNTATNKLIAGAATDIFVTKLGMDVGINVVNGITNNALNVYPNPSSGAVTVNYYTSENTNMTIRLTNLSGQIIYSEQKKQNAGVYNQTLDFSNKAKGIYFLEVISDNETMVRKLVIE